MENIPGWKNSGTFLCLGMIKQMTTTELLALQCRLCWEQLEWRAWPDTRTDQIIQTMAQAWAQLPQELRKPRWGQPLTRSIDANWQAAMDRELRNGHTQISAD